MLLLSSALLAKGNTLSGGSPVGRPLPAVAVAPPFSACGTAANCWAWPEDDAPKPGNGSASKICPCPKLPDYMKAKFLHHHQHTWSLPVEDGSLICQAQTPCLENLSNVVLKPLCSPFASGGGVPGSPASDSSISSPSSVAQSLDSLLCGWNKRWWSAKNCTQDKYSTQLC